MRILVTGASGQLGKTFQKLETNWENISFTFCSSAELDITNEIQVTDYFEQHAFDWVINCAAYTKVDLAEEEIEKAFAVNQLGVKNLVSSCEKHALKLIHFSTDYVFDGNASTPYTEESDCNPINVYGKSKRAGELEILDAKIQAIIIRTSWVFSEFNANFAQTMLTLFATKEQINVVTDQLGTPTSTQDLVEITMEIIQKHAEDFSTDIFHVTNSGVASWYDFAYELKTSTATSCEITPIPSTRFPTKAVRPSYSILSKEKLNKHFQIVPRHWKETIKTMLSFTNDSK